MPAITIPSYTPAFPLNSLTPVHASHLFMSLFFLSDWEQGQWLIHSCVFLPHSFSAWYTIGRKTCVFNKWMKHASLNETPGWKWSPLGDSRSQYSTHSSWPYYACYPSHGVTWGWTQGEELQESSPHHTSSSGPSSFFLSLILVTVLPLSRMQTAFSSHF